MPGLEIFKYDFSSQKHDFNLILYLEEIVKDSIINQKTTFLVN
jgi:hypothetical protein